MGSELGPGFRRRPPDGWSPARAYPVDWRAEARADGEGSRSGIDTTLDFEGTWEVHVDGRPPYTLHDARRVPVWVVSSTFQGRRWYRPRLRGSYGLQKRIGVPGHVDPANAAGLWIDWDAAYREHEESWDRHDRIERERARRSHVVDRVANRVMHPFAERLRPGEEQLVDERIAADAARAEQTHADARAAHDALLRARGVSDDDRAELSRRVARVERLKATGRAARATVVGSAPTGRTVGGVPVVLITVDVDDAGEVGRRTYEHVWGPRHAKHFKPGRQVDVRIDPDDPAEIELAL